MPADVTRGPDCGPLSLTLKRGEGATVEAKWRNPGSATDGESAARWSGIDQVWELFPSRDKSYATSRYDGTTEVDMAGDRMWVTGGSNIYDNVTLALDRTLFHPVTQGRYLKSVLLDVGAWNQFAHYHDDGGEMPGIKHTRQSMDFHAPRMPGISRELDESTGIVTFTITAAADDDERERYDTMWCVKRQDSANRGNAYARDTMIKAWAASSQDEFTYSFDLGQVGTLNVGENVLVTVMAYSRGIAGESAYAVASYVHCYPQLPLITGIKASSLSATGVVTVTFNAQNSDYYRPIDKIQLQRLANVTYGTPSTAGNASGWTDVGSAVDNGVCTGFSDLVPDAIPDVKKHTWYRLKVTHGTLTRYSDPVEAKCLYRAKDSVSDDAVKFISLVQGGDGVSLVARLGWQTDDSNACEIAWSEHEDAWESNEQPSSFVFDWEDSSHPSGYAASGTVTIRGLEEGTSYFLRARRVLLVNGSVSSAGAWCPPAKALYPITPVSAPTDVTLMAPSYVERGKGVDLMWTYNGAEQTAWQVFDTQSNRRVVLASGAGPTGATTIPASVIKSRTSLMLSVSITTGGDWTESQKVPVSIVDAPTLSASVGSELESQPLSVTLACSHPTCDVSLYVTSRGVSTSSPSGPVSQVAGDVVWSTSESPTWTLSGGSYTATITAPANLDLHDGAVYDVSAVVKDRETGLSSGTAKASFSVAWEHAAHYPGGTVEPNGGRLSAKVTPIAPDGAAETDVCDVYRVTHDGASLIASDVPFGTPVTDMYAPYANRPDAELSYRLCTRTADGDLDWYDFPYELAHGSLRFDWDGKSVELPYNVTSSDSWQKGFELHEHWDGSRGGCWDEGATREASFTTDVVKVESWEQRRLIGELASYAGPVFARTPDGAAFQANVQVENYNVDYGNAAVPVSFKTTEVDLTDEFRVQPDDWGEGE